MEVLNRNQRKSAYWRTGGLIFFLIAVLSTIVFSMHNSYSSIGAEKFEDEKVKMQQKINKLQQKNKELEAKVGTLDNNQLMAIKDERIKGLEFENKSLDRKLKDCRNQGGGY